MHKECMEMKNLMDLQHAGCLSEGQRSYLNHHLLFCPECMIDMVSNSTFLL
jgi:hypothetical protein